MAVLHNAGFADEHGVVLGASRQDLDDPADLLVATDDRVELARTRGFGEIAPVLRKCLIRLFRIRGRHSVAPANVAQRTQELIPRGTDVVGQREEEVLDGDVLVAHLAPTFVSSFEGPTCVARALAPPRLGLGAVGSVAGGPGCSRRRDRRPPGRARGSGHGLLLLRQGVDEVDRVARGCWRRQHGGGGAEHALVYWFSVLDRSTLSNFLSSDCARILTCPDPMPNLCADSCPKARSSMGRTAPCCLVISDSSTQVLNATSHFTGDLSTSLRFALAPANLSDVDRSHVHDGER